MSQQRKDVVWESELEKRVDTFQSRIGEANELTNTHRPSTPTNGRLEECHIKRINVGSFLTIDLYEQH